MKGCHVGLGGADTVPSHGKCICSLHSLLPGSLLELRHSGCSLLCTLLRRAAPCHAGHGWEGLLKCVTLLPPLSTYYCRVCLVSKADLYMLGLMLFILLAVFMRSCSTEGSAAWKSPEGSRCRVTGPRCWGWAQQWGAAERLFSGWRSGD